MQVIAISDATHGNTKPPGVQTLEPQEPSPAELSLPSNGPEKDSVQIKELQRELARNDISLSYRHDDDSNRLVITLVDSTTGETIRQIPDDVVLRLSSDIRGHFLNETV